MSQLTLYNAARPPHAPRNCGDSGLFLPSAFCNGEPPPSPIGWERGWGEGFARGVEFSPRLLPLNPPHGAAPAGRNRCRFVDPNQFKAP